jgi:cell division protein FtsQ
MAKRVRNSARRQPRRRWRAALLLLPPLLMGAAVLMGWHYLSQPGRMPLREIAITGEFTWLKRSDIEQRVARAIDGGFLDLDLKKVRDSVLRMPWVDQVSVRRVWPDRLQMHVTEQVPLAWWNDDALVNLDGRVFRPARLPDLEGLPHLAGRDADAPRVVAFYLKLHARLLDGALQVRRVALSRRGEWQVEFNDGMRLLLGRESVEQREQTFLRLYPQLLAQMRERPARVDMRYAHGFAVRWRKQDENQEARGLDAAAGKS